jgi:hypothetical protein
MKRKIVIILVLQLILNVVLLSYFIHLKRTGIISSIHKIFSKETIVTEEQLQAMRGFFSPVYFDTSNNKQGEPFKILVIGNSLTYSGKAEKYGWMHGSGMAASSIGKDFAHLIFTKTENILPNRKLSLRIARLIEFERNYSVFNFASVDSMVAYHPDIIVFQLGENVPFNKINTPGLFTRKYITLINCFKKDNNPLIICTTPFFPSFEKNEIIKQVSLSTKSFLADLSHLVLLNQDNYAKNERNYSGDKKVWKIDGIGIHPGDYGMENIAQQIFIIINASIENKNIDSIKLN